jgi:putative ABC transport system permease protein
VPRWADIPRRKRAELATTLAHDIETIPGVQSVSIADGLPGNSGFSVGIPEVEGRGPVGAQTFTMAYNTVDASYFKTLRIPLVAGRIFDEADGPNAVIINRALAEYLWPGASAVGRTFRAFAPVRPSAQAGPGSWSTVVGVVGNIEAMLGDQTLTMQMYYPFVAHPAPAPTAPQPPGVAARRYLYRTLIVRAGDPSSLLPAIKARVHGIDPAAVVTQVALAADVYADFFAPQRFALVVMSLFSAIAIFYAAAGIFIVLSEAVVNRTREIGIRVALGAMPRDVLRMIVGRGALLTAAGTLIGIAAALAASRVIRGLLYEVSPYDPISFAIVAALFLAVALIACWVPSGRALPIDPAAALRVD